MILNSEKSKKNTTNFLKEVGVLGIIKRYLWNFNEQHSI